MMTLLQLAIWNLAWLVCLGLVAFGFYRWGWLDGRKEEHRRWTRLVKTEVLPQLEEVRRIAEEGQFRAAQRRADALAGVPPHDSAQP